MNIEENWKQLIKKCLYDGHPHVKDDGDKLQEILINHCFIDNPLNKFGKQKITSEMFINMIKKGVFDIKEYPIKGEALADYVSSLDNPKQIYLLEENGEKPFIYTYPERLQNIRSVNRVDDIDNYDQLSVIKKRLTEHEGSNRAVATLYSVGLDYNEQHIPCLQLLQATIRDNKLVLHIFFRSNDLYSAFPSNMLFISYIGIKLTEELRSIYPSLEFLGISYTSSSLHIYNSDLDQAKEAIK